MTFKKIAERVLAESNTPLRAEEIWSEAVKKKYHKLINSKGKTPWATIRYQIYISMRDEKNSPFAMTEDFPRRFFLKKMRKK